MLVSFYCTETQGIAGCDTVSAVAAFALTREFCASSLSKLLVLPCLFCAVLQAHTSLASATLISLHQQQIKHKDVAHAILLCTPAAASSLRAAHTSGHICGKTYLLETLLCCVTLTCDNQKHATRQQSIVHLVDVTVHAPQTFLNALLPCLFKRCLFWVGPLLSGTLLIGPAANYVDVKASHKSHKGTKDGFNTHGPRGCTLSK